jgi:autotransporter-associated beta strand protein
MVINGGTVNFATTTTRWLILNQWDTSPGQLDVNGGPLNINGNSAIRCSIGNGGSQAASVINLNGGAITFYSDNATTVGGTGQLDLQRSGGTASSGTVNLNGGTLTVPQVMSTVTSGNRVFNFNGGTLKPTAATTTFLQGLSAANVKAGGAIIDSAGFDVTIAQPLLNGGGGLTKQGAGILLLSGANTYAGSTIVKAGTLALAQATLAPSSTVAVSNAAFLRLDFGTTNRVSALVLAGVSQAPGLYNNTTGAPYITGSGTLLVQPVATNPTNITFAVSGSSLSLSWPEDHLGWVLQQQTNALSTGVSTNWVDVPGSASITSTNITINPALPTAFYRLRQP